MWQFKKLNGRGNFVAVSGRKVAVEGPNVAVGNYFKISSKTPINTEMCIYARVPFVSCHRHSSLSFDLQSSLRELYTSWLWFLLLSRKEIAKDHQLRVAQDQKPFEKMQIFLPHI
jgi:hypothetical protein